VVLPAD